MDTGKSNSQRASIKTLTGSYFSSPRSGAPLKVLSPELKIPSPYTLTPVDWNWGNLVPKGIICHIPSFEFFFTNYNSFRNVVPGSNPQELGNILEKLCS